MRHSQHSKEKIDEAKALYEKGMSYKEIAVKLGFSNESMVRYHIKPGFKEEQFARMKLWRERNPERWQEISRVASKRFQEKMKIHT